MKDISPTNANFVNTVVFAKSTLKLHVSSVHEGNKPIKCKFCEYLCSTKGVVKNHISSVHERKKPFQCKVCDIKFFKE